MDCDPDEGLTRVPGENDPVKLARELNRLNMGQVAAKTK
jgi:hypothetical protein